jgi:hypothetical protein
MPPGPKAPNGYPVVEILVIVTFEGKGLRKLFGVETDLNVTVVPTTKPVVSETTKVLGLVAATQRSDVAAWLGVAKRTELAASASTARIRDVFFI